MGRTVNEQQAVQAMQALGANWPHLRDLDELGLELWYRNALRETPFESADGKPGALEVIDRLVATCTFPPKPHDWIEAYRGLRAEARRALALDTRSITAPPADMAAGAQRIRQIRQQFFPQETDQ